MCCSFLFEIDFQTKETFQILWIRKKYCLLQYALSINILLKSLVPVQEGVVSYGIWEPLSERDQTGMFVLWSSCKICCGFINPFPVSTFREISQKVHMGLHGLYKWGKRRGGDDEESSEYRWSRKKSSSKDLLHFISPHGYVCNYLGSTWANRHGKKIDKLVSGLFVWQKQSHYVPCLLRPLYEMYVHL